MKTNNQTEQKLLELAVATAANEDGIATANPRDISETGRMPAWSPLEVWRTRVKTPMSLTRTESSPL